MACSLGFHILTFERSVFENQASVALKPKVSLLGWLVVRGVRERVSLVRMRLFFIQTTWIFVEIRVNIMNGPLLGYVLSNNNRLLPNILCM